MRSHHSNPNKHYVNNFNISETFKDVSNTLQNFTFMETRVLAIAGGGGSLDPPPLPPVKGLLKEGLMLLHSFDDSLPLSFMLVFRTHITFGQI